ncbi:hypothetical protein PsorP6_011849 [Peronosclerospora sorghi]|uniref:Uncharacterized protein n=1 Tax=Peronosclerospora sorghi TaxID=230839 RepID=A0ACC0WJM1_9STRA|nr:hypothetical protein PsorP6_011849 [Peronosclerospora sorghi]
MCVVEISIDVAADQSELLLFVIVKLGLWAPPESSRTTTVKMRNYEGQVRSLLCREYQVPIGVVHEVPVVEWPLSNRLMSWFKLTNLCIEWLAGAISVIPAMSNQSARAAVVTTTVLTKKLPVEVTVAQWDPEVEWIDAVEFKKKFQNGEYAKVFHLNVLTDHGSSIDNKAVHLLVAEFGDMLCEELPDGLSPERDIEHSLQMK